MDDHSIVEYSLSERERKEWLFGADAAMHLEIYMESQQEQFDKDYLIRKLVEDYEKRMNQDLQRYK